MLTPRISFLIVLATCFWLNLSLTSPMTVSRNNKYLYVGTCSVNTASTFNTNSGTLWNPLEYMVTYPITLGFVTIAQVYMSIKSLHVNIAQNRISFHGKQTSITTASFVLTLNSNFTNYIKRLEYSYLVITNQYVNNQNLMCVIQNLQVSKNLGAYYNFVKFYHLDSPLNKTGRYNALISVVGYDLHTTDNSRVINFFINAAVSSDYVVVNIVAVSAIPTYINNVTFNCLIYNIEYYNTPTYAAFLFQGGIGYLNQDGTMGVTYSPALPFKDSYMYSSNTMVDLSYINVRGDNFLDFSIDYNNSNGFTVTSSNTNSSFKTNYTTFLTYYCAYTIPLYYSNENICYDACPVRTYQDQSTLSCLPCLYDCYTCNNSNSCISCNGQADHRILDSSNHRCIPMSGYYETNVSICPPCPDPCAVCTSSKICTVCFQGYILNNQNRCHICYDCFPWRSENTGLIIGLVVVAVIITVVVIVIVVYICMIYKQILVRPPPLINAIVPPELGSSSLSLDNIVPAVLGEWRPRTRETSMTQVCSIDLWDQTYFKTNCNHYFHVKCIIEWSQKDNRCPNCRHPNFPEQDHKVFCKQCRRKEKLINFRELVRSYQQHRIDEEMTCPDCRIIPI